MNEMLSFFKSSVPKAMRPMSEEDIDVIREAKKGYTIPKLFLDFLRAAGKYYYPWEGFDYKLVDDNGKFYDLSELMEEDDIQVSQFADYGIKTEQCLFFVTNQGIVYYFIRLDETDDDPMVYSVVNCADRPGKPFRFSRLIIDSYNEVVAIEEQRKDPWSDFSKSLGVVNWITENFPFKNVEKYTLKTDTYVKYKVGGAKNDTNCLEYLNPVLKDSLKKGYSVYIYSDDKLYIYRAREDDKAYNKIGLDIYKDNTAVLDMRYEWGWFTVNGEVYIFGDTFIEKIKENIDKFDITEEQ